MGGYASFPICIAASILRIKFVIYENNLIIGKANRTLLPFSKKIFVSTNVGSLIVIDLKTGKLVNVIKVDRGKISRPLTDNKYMYLIRDDSIIKLN